MNRLFEIVTILLNKGTATAQELADRFSVSTRTIYRDIDVLSSAGVPVYMNKGKGGGIHLLENYAINRTLISEQESESLLMAIKTLQVINYPELDRILEKLGALFKNIPNHDWVEVDFSPWGSASNEKNKFDNIKQAMLRRNVIRFDYINGEGQKSNRLVEPQKLIFKSNAWYLASYCRQRQVQRTFKISRLKNLEVMAETFERKSSSKEKTKEKTKETNESSQPLISLNLRFQTKVLNRIYEYFDDSLLCQNEDGSITLVALLPEGEWLYSYIMSFGNFVEVLEPEHIRKTIVRRIRETLKIYEN
ncbi:Predicted DNA-binding transcriptional regulator YafY, contains an HTH and WYL domains [Pelosinus fermentans]|nr:MULTISPECIES: YafY family protein [Pelosinus]OAM95120.1 WYL domain containing protein [Pelosinus fermentans DSM 17108]SDR23585.1 Predicted DNA-binding transcriptional regulator YafY, contains an HTH and WYL domains [Pelosinus fermentans]